MKLTLNKIMKHNPCGQDSDGGSGISRLAKHLNKADFNDIGEFELIEVLKSNGIKDAIWCLRCYNYLDYCLFLANMTESVLPIYEAKHDSKALLKVIQAIRDFKASKTTKDGLNAVVADAANMYASIYLSADDKIEKRIEIEKLFIKHFG